jgi:60 kDa SS-A/Ro ribonucleoprotein
MRWVTGREAGSRSFKGPNDRVYGAAVGELPTLIQAFEEAKSADEATVIKLIRDHGLTREMIPTEIQKSPKVWEALLDKMPLGAMIRTLGRMGACGLLAPLSDASKLVVQRLGDRDYLRKSRVHPIQVLAAILTYGAGHGQKGSLSWTVVSQVTDALNDAFYASFSNVEPTGKNFYLGIDVSGSMTGGQVAGLAGLTPNMGAAAMAMLIARTEPNHFIGGFSTNFVDLGISKSDRLDAAMKKCQRDFGGTDCAVAIKHALKNKYPVDAFVVVSDGETWSGETHTSQALVDYRQKMARNAKLIVINMVANRTRLTDPTDDGSLDVVGFDASVPTLINGFLGGNVSTGQEDAETE